MTSNFQSSFIPKDPVVTEDVFKKKKAGPVGVLAVSLFIFSIIIAGAMFVYKGLLKNEIQNIQSELAAAEKNIDKKTINELMQFSKKLNIVKSIVVKHQVVSGFLDSLASSTVKTVQFTNLSFGTLSKDNLSVTLTGKTVNYASVALQENVFSKNKFWKNMQFSELGLLDKGMISFKVAVGIDPQIILYSLFAAPDALSSDIQNSPDNLDGLDMLDSEINNL